jgi:hypothetical protein
MRAKLFLAATGVAVAGLGFVGGASAPARAQNVREAEMIGFHQLCDKGDRKACIRFGIMLGQNQQRHADWRRQHAEWFWYER